MDFRRFVVFLLAGSAVVANCETIPLHLNGTEPLRQVEASYQCDARGIALGMPTATFQVRYVNGAGNSLAIVRVHGKDLVFVEVFSADGGRYASGPYIWWESHAGPSMEPQALFSSESEGGAQAVCKQMKVARGAR